MERGTRSLGISSTGAGQNSAARLLCAVAIGVWLVTTTLLAPDSGRAETPGGSDPAVAPSAAVDGGIVVQPAPPPALGTTRFKLTPEQQETLRLAQEAEARTLLGLAADAPLPADAALSEEQKATIRAAREAELRRVLGLGASDPIPDRRAVTAEQVRKIEAAHEARIRAALGLAADAPLAREAIAPSPPVPGAPQ